VIVICKKTHKLDFDVTAVFVDIIKLDYGNR